MVNSSAQGIRFFDRPGVAPTVVFVHGAGFHARCWDAVIEALPYHCVALNLSGHGGVAARPGNLQWRDFVQDVVDGCAAAGVSEGAIGVGHSLGGYAVAVAAALRPRLFRALLLIDPVILPEAQYGHDVAAPPARRRATFTSAEEMRERLATRPSFARWNPRVLDDYCRFGLRPDGALWCEPEFEGRVYAAASAAAANPYPLFGSVPAHVTFLESGRVDADNPFSASPTAAGAAEKFAHARRVVDERFSHFLPMEAPEVVASWVRTIVRDLDVPA
jgi:pimeloyl-ACP methyl ester carboxylesterase